MSKYDDELSRIHFLMEYNAHGFNEGRTNIECHKEGADGKVYGILKEGSKYYIKTTEKGKENLSESYEYINGFNYRRENEYSSYNAASKALEEKLIALNEDYGRHEDVSTVDFGRNEKTLAYLTEEARKDLDRMKMVMENSDRIGKFEDPESKGSASPSDTTKNNKPYSEKKDEKLNKDDVAQETDPKKANKDYKDAGDANKKLESDKAPEGEDTVKKESTDAKPDLEGKSVAAEHPSGGKATVVKEGIGDISAEDFQDGGGDDLGDGTPLDGEAPAGDPAADGAEAPVADGLNAGAEGGETDYNHPVGMPEDNPDEDDDDFEDAINEAEALLSGYNETLAGPHGGEQLTTDTVDGKKPETKESEEALNGQGIKGKGKAITVDKMNESQKKAVKKAINEMANKVIDKVVNGKKAPKKKETLQEAISRIVKEEAQQLGVWGQHPRYGKEPFSTPENKEVMKGTADRDINDDSTKHDNTYGHPKREQKPYTEVLVDQVVKLVKEQLLKKK